MKKFTIHGLALALGFAMTVPAFAQYGQSIWNQNENQYIGSNRSTPVYPATRIRNRQDQESPSDAPVKAPSQEDNPAPLENAPCPTGTVYGDSVVNGGDCADGSCGTDRGSLFGGKLAGAGSLLGGGGEANWVGGIYGLVFTRDYEDDLAFSASATNGPLFSTDTDLDYFGGLEVMIGRRGCDGRGWEMSYWGLYPSTNDVTLTGLPYTVLPGLNYVSDGQFGLPVDTVYDVAGDHRIYRDNEFHNFEWNMLSNGGNNCGNAFEWLAGFRWFEFDEFFRYRTSTLNAGYPTVFDYDIDVQNTLLGFQMGGRKEICIGSRMRLHLGAKAGVFNNHVRHRQLMRDPNTGIYAQINAGGFAGDDYNFSSSKNDIAMLGELDLGLSYQMGAKWRLRGGYRAIGVSGVALAPNQVPRSFLDANEIRAINSNGSLILGGFYIGGEFCF